MLIVFFYCPTKGTNTIDRVNMVIRQINMHNRPLLSILIVSYYIMYCTNAVGKDCFDTELA